MAPRPSILPSGLERSRLVERERRRPRAGGAGRDVAGRQRVADEDGIDRGHVDRDAARRVAGDVDDLRAARQVKGDAIGDGLELFDPVRPQASLAPGVPQEPQEGTDLYRSAARARLAHLAARARRIGLVHVDRDAVVAAEPFGEADVIGIAVGQDQAADVAHRTAHGLQLGLEVTPLAGDAGVDQGQLAVLLDEVGRDDVVADAVKGRREPHRVWKPQLGRSVGVGCKAGESDRLPS